MFYVLLYATLCPFHSSIANMLMGMRELVALLNLSSWCLVKVERLFLAVPRGCLRFVVVVFPDHTHLLFFTYQIRLKQMISKICLEVICILRCHYFKNGSRHICDLMTS